MVVHRRLRRHWKDNVYDIERDTYGLEFARGLRGAGTSQRTRGPYLRIKESVLERRVRDTARTVRIQRPGPGHVLRHGNR